MYMYDIVYSGQVGACLLCMHGITCVDHNNIILIIKLCIIFVNVCV